MQGTTIWHKRIPSLASIDGIFCSRKFQTVTVNLMRIRCKKGNPNIPCPQYSVGTRSIEYPTCFILQCFGLAVCLYGIAYPKQHTEVLLANVIPFAVFAELFGITAKKSAKPNKLSTFVKSSLK